MGTRVVGRDMDFMDEHEGRRPADRLRNAHAPRTSMHFTATVHHGPDYLLVKGSGPALLTDLCGFMDLVATVAGKGRYRRAVLDLLGVEIALTFTEHLQLGAHAAEHLRDLERVASIVSVQNRKGTSEKAAQKLGLQLRTFTSLAEGLRWIGEEPVNPASGGNA
ncbi:MAG: hypothetical protein Q8R01_01870 [Ramlibacter sp.]|nr:hypothetical protein [Ramlibacter sp.]